MFWDDLEPKKIQKPEIGGDLSKLSIAELENYAGELDGELSRVKAMIAQKRSSREAASAIFKQ